MDRTTHYTIIGGKHITLFLDALHDQYVLEIEHPLGNGGFRWLTITGYEKLQDLRRFLNEHIHE